MWLTFNKRSGKIDTKQMEGGGLLKTATEIRMLRSGKGFFTQSDMLRALEKEGIRLTRAGYSAKENGKSPFTSKELVAIAKILGISLDEAASYLV